MEFFDERGLPRLDYFHSAGAEVVAEALTYATRLTGGIVDSGCLLVALYHHRNSISNPRLPGELVDVYYQLAEITDTERAVNGIEQITDEVYAILSSAYSMAQSSKPDSVRGHRRINVSHLHDALIGRDHGIASVILGRLNR